MFFAIRWWRMTDRRRTRRFSLFPMLASGFWSILLLLLLLLFRQSQEPDQLSWYWVGALMMTAAIVQLASPWEQPPTPTPKRVRLRYA